MLSILTHDPVPGETRLPDLRPEVEPKVIHVEPAAEKKVEAAHEETQVEEVNISESVEYLDPEQQFEIVLGKRQVASVLFVATVIVAVFSSFAYLAGEAIAAKKPAPVAAAAPDAAPPAAPAVVADPLLQADVVDAQPKPEPPVFANPKLGSVYLQMGAVEKGIGVIFAEGLRKHGFDAFVAPGPNDHIFRVLIGPIPDPRSYERVKDSVDKLGIGTFGKKYVQDNAQSTPTQQTPQRTTP